MQDGNRYNPGMNTDPALLQKTARQAGAIYFVFAILGIIGEFVIPNFVVAGDAAATMQKIAASEWLYRLEILLGFVSHIMFIVLVVWLFSLFKHVDYKYSLVMLLLVVVGVALALANLFYRFQPLALSGSNDYLSVFSSSQRDALVLNSLRFHSFNSYLPILFWGLWLFPFGMLTIKSRFIPKIFGYLLLIAGLAYLVNGFTTIALPSLKQAIAPYFMPFYFGEVPIIFGLLFARISRPKE